MKKKAGGFVPALSLLVAGLFLALGACAPKVQTPFTPVNAQDLTGKTTAGEYVRKVDNFLVIMDSSSSMAKPYTVGTKFEVSKGLIKALNATVPELGWQGGLRVFGPVGLSNGHDNNVILYGMKTYKRADFGAALAQVTEPAGVTPLAKSLTQAGEDLAKSSGKIALIIFSDGEVESAAEVKAAAAGLKASYGDRLCVYPVMVGDSPEGGKLMENLAKTVGCGFVSQGDKLLSGVALADFVTTVFLEKGKPIAAAPSSAPIPETVAAPAPQPVVVRLQVEFDFDKSDIRPTDHDALARFAKYLKEYPDIKVSIEGHTCNMGTAAYNQKLSERRAAGVVRYLVEEHGVVASRLTAKGFGLSQPMADNATDFGRQQNRRVEAVLRAN